MAGPAIKKALEKREYTEFFLLVHDFSEQHVLPHLAMIHGCGHLLTRLADQESPPRPLDDPAMAAQVRTAASAVVGLEIIRRAQAYLWPGTHEGRDSEAENRERWAPYDGAAWDVFLAGLVDAVGPSLEVCLAQAMQILTSLGMGTVVEPTRVESALRETGLSMKKSCIQVREALKPSHYEAVVAAWLERKGGTES
jgi:hypothetical protein